MVINMTLTLTKKEVLPLRQVYVIKDGYCGLVASMYQQRESILSLLRPGDYCIPGGKIKAKYYIECISKEAILEEASLDDIDLKKIMSVFYRDRQLHEIRATPVSTTKVDMLKQFVYAEYPQLKLTHEQIGEIVGLTRVTCTRAIMELRGLRKAS